MTLKEAPALKLVEIKKEYPGVKALSGINLDFQANEIHGLIGENGAGKSTLIKILAGVVKADDGEIFMNNQKVEIHCSKDSQKLGLSFIHQELNLIEYMNAAENIFLGHPYPKTRWGTVSWKALNEQAKEILKTLDIDIPLNMPVGRLSTVNRSMVIIARAFAVSASIYFMDEPTTALAAHEKEMLFEVIRKLKAIGKTVVYISHDLDEVLLLADRITVMRDGKIVQTLKKNESEKPKLIQLMTGRNMTSLFPPRLESEKFEEIILPVRNLTGPKIKNVSFDLKKGEVLGVAGIVGAGRTELLRTLFGVDKVLSGEILLNGSPFLPNSPSDSIQKGIALVPEERRSQGLILNRSVLENIALVHLKALSRGPFLDDKHAKKEAKQIGSLVRLKTADYRNAVATLSGGNQQKVVLAKYMLRKPQVFLLDEPTKGVDVGARYEIYSIIRELAKEGSGILLVASDFSELIGLAERILVMHEGKIIAIVNAKDINEASLLKLCYGLEGN
ncbi:MAG TPA: sugar ABC transporter ATP-binding protein [Rectinema sp.]|nr:sugar ABC transporter ATP-binding protein [Rectinema sp.]